MHGECKMKLIKMCLKFKCGYNWTEKLGTLHEDLSMFVLLTAELNVS